jgi:uncharacterized protein (DUF2252 family)
MDEVERSSADGQAVERIRRFNAGRDPHRLRLKYDSMRRDPFSFFRGTCHLFYDDLPRDWPLHRAPLIWICGDLHLQNFGTYHGDDDRVHVDVNDFDEGCLAPLTWDLARFLTSLLVGAQTLGVKQSEGSRLSEAFLDAYRGCVSQREASVIDHASSAGALRRLLDGAKQRTRTGLLDSRTELQDGMRRIRIDGKKALAADDMDRHKLMPAMSAFAARQPNPATFELLDVARRVAGVGSLGVERYILLVSGEGSPDGNYLLDLKHQPGSSLAPHLQWPQPAWPDEASRAVWIERSFQAIPPRALNALTIEGRAYTLRELLPTEDRLKLADFEGKPEAIEQVVRAMGQIVGRGSLRCAGHCGAASVDDLAAFAAQPHWPAPLVAYANSYADKVGRDWETFRRAPDAPALVRG